MILVSVQYKELGSVLRIVTKVGRVSTKEICEQAKKEKVNISFHQSDLSRTLKIFSSTGNLIVP